MLIPDLFDSWMLSLRAERKSPATLDVYGDGVRAYLRWCEEQGLSPVLDRDQVRTFVADLLDAGAAPSTVTSRLLALKRLEAWAVEEEEIDNAVIATLRPPKIDQPVLEPLTEPELKALLDACTGKAFEDVRDAAIVRLMAETAARAGEVAAIGVADVDLRRGLVVIRRGKGGKGRIVPLSPNTCAAIDRYLRRARAGHRLADSSPALWLGARGKAFGYDALHKTLRMRADAAGIERFHPHLLRHTAAHRWLAAGGSEGGLMAVAGWERPDMLMRYTRARATDRAIAEARGLDLGNL